MSLSRIISEILSFIYQTLKRSRDFENGVIHHTYASSCDNLPTKFEVTIALKFKNGHATLIMPT